jgi:[ribosomal protein S18]-alanine N-acetyltransferase
MQTVAAPLRLDIQAVVSLAQLEAHCFPDPWDEATFAAAFGRPVFVAYGIPGGTGLHAYLTAYLVGDELEIVNIAVAPELRGRGLGTRLLGHVLQQADKMGINQVYLEVRAGNVPARRLYARHGFAVVGTRKRYYTDTGEDAQVMVRQRAAAGAETI